MTLEIVCIALVAACWGGYPLLARASGYGGPLGTLVLALAGAAADQPGRALLA